jgi:superfamily II RNA helicase
MTPKADGRLKNVLAAIGVPEKEPFTPDPFQVDAVAAIEKGDCLVTAPTGSGKTWIAVQAISRIRQAGGKAWYASPLKALSNSKHIEFSDYFGHENVGILTGDRKENPDASVIVGTTEILRNQLYDAMHQGVDLNTDFVILDEAHFLGDPERGVVWEEIMIYLPPRIPMLMLSATIGNAAQISGWLSSIRSKRCVIVEETRRPVPLFPVFLHPSGTLFPLLGQQKKIHHKVNEYITAKRPPLLSLPGRLPPFGKILKILKKFRLLPVIFFLKSRADCDNALDICEENIQNDPERREKITRRIQEFAGQIPHLASHRQIRHLENQAVGSHHSGQLPAWKLLIESLMTDGLLDAVFATSTVAAGVNFPARTVGFLNSDKFNGVDFLPLTPTEFHQMTGRAGRRGMDKIGFAAVLPGKYMDPRLMASLFNSPPAEVLSQIRINFSMTLNLLLSHTPEQIGELLRKSFAAYLLAEEMKKTAPQKKGYAAHKRLWMDFMKHFDFLKETGYVSENGLLTEDGIWASRLRVDHPLMIAEGFKRDLFPQSDPRLLSAMIASFVNDRDVSDRGGKDLVPNPLKGAMKKVDKGLQPFRELMESRGFETRSLMLKPALTLYLWASGLRSWEDVVRAGDMAEGDLAMLILRTADNLRHIVALQDVFPQAADAAASGIEMILREPVSSYGI